MIHNNGVIQRILVSAGGGESYIDLMPTLLELCGIDPPADVQFDGDSLVPLLQGPDVQADWPDRTILLHNERSMS